MPKVLDWQAVRKDYESGLNPAALGVKYNCSPTVVYGRALAEKWIKPLEEDDEIDPEFLEDEDEIIKPDVALNEQKRHLARLHREFDASTAKIGQMKQWIKEGTAGNIESRRKAMYQVLTMGNRTVMLLNASRILKNIIEAEIALGNVPKGKKAKLEQEAKDFEDSRFGTRSAPPTSPNGRVAT